MSDTVVLVIAVAGHDGSDQRQPFSGRDRLRTGLVPQRIDQLHVTEESRIEHTFTIPRPTDSNDRFTSAPEELELCR